jgi:hypothetical protein
VRSRPTYGCIQTRTCEAFYRAEKRRGLARECRKPGHNRTCPERAAIAAFDPRTSTRRALGLRDRLFAVSIGIPMTSGFSTKHSIVAGFHAVTSGGPMGREAQFKQLANSSGSGWHAMLKSEVINRR